MNKIEQAALSYIGKGKQEIISRYPTVEWCAATVCCILDDCNIDVFKSISCTTMANAWAKDSRMQCVQLDNVQGGDILFFDKFDSINGDCDHVAIVADFDDNIKTGVYYVDGNGGSDGRTIIKKHFMSYSELQKYAARIFRYVGGTETKSDVPATQTKREEKTVSITLNQVSEGDANKSVKLLQSLLISEGYSCGTYGADGEFGEFTDKAVRKYQLAKGLDVDGVVGQQTWNKLLS